MCKSCYKLRQVVPTNYGKFIINYDNFITNQDKMYCISRQLKYFITNYGTLWSYFKFGQKVILNIGGITDCGVIINYVVRKIRFYPKKKKITK